MPLNVANYINLTRWFVTLAAQPRFLPSLGEFELCSEAMVEPVVKKAEPVKPAAPAAAAAAEGDEPVLAAPKAQEPS